MVRCSRPRSHTATQPRVSSGRWVWRCWLNRHSTTRWAAANRVLDVAGREGLPRDAIARQGIVDQHGRVRRRGHVDDGRRAARSRPRRLRAHPRRHAPTSRPRMRPDRRRSAPCRRASPPSGSGCRPSIGGAMVSGAIQPFTSAPANTATTPAVARARAASMRRMRAWACGLRTKRRCSASANTMSST